MIQKKQKIRISSNWN